jgi:hypothetical protein
MTDLTTADLEHVLAAATAAVQNAEAVICDRYPAATRVTSLAEIEASATGVSWTPRSETTRPSSPSCTSRCPATPTPPLPTGEARRGRRHVAQIGEPVTAMLLNDLAVRVRSRPRCSSSAASSAVT